jgi:hypothetical protein
MQEEMGDKNFHAFAAVIVGSRQILVREMDKNGKWIMGLQLCQQADPISSKQLVVTGSLRDNSSCLMLWPS